MTPTPLTFAVLIGLILLGLAPSASGASGEHAVAMGIGYQRMTFKAGGSSDGLCGFLAYRHGVADDWNLHASVETTGFFNRDRRFSVLSAGIGAAYLVDALAFVPEIRAGVGYVGPITGGAVKPDLGVMAGLALEYRRVRPFGVGVAAEYRYLIRNRDDIGGIVSLLVYVTRYF